MFGNLMGSIDLDSALQLLKNTFEKEGLKSIVVYIDKDGKVKTEKLVFNVYEKLTDLVTNCPEALIYLNSNK
jgi:hypothetical protein